MRRENLTELCGVIRFGSNRCRNLGPGGGNLFPQLAGDHLEPDQRIDVTKKIKEYDVKDWAKIVAVFKEWKFAPEVRGCGPTTAGGGIVTDVLTRAQHPVLPR